MKKGIRIAVFVGFLGLLGYFAFTQTRSRHELSLSELIDRAEAKEVRTAVWRSDMVTGQLKDGTTYQTRVADIESPLGYSTFQRLELGGVEVKNECPPSSAKILPLIGFLFVPLIFIVTFYYLFVKPAQTPTSGFSPPRGSPEERLAKIDDLHARGAISDEERSRLRESVLKSL